MAISTERLSTYDIAVVIPSWNEGENLRLLLPALKGVLDEIGVAFEIVVVDAGSQDGTSVIAESHGARILVQTERGYGGALLTGFAATTAPYIVTMDGDLSHRPMFVADFWHSRHTADILIASRYVEGGSAEMGVLRRILSVLLNRSYSKILSIPLRDLSSGFRMYRREALGNLNLQSRDFDILEEILVLVYTGGGVVREIPFTYRVRGSGKSHARLIKFGVAFLRTLLRMRRLRSSSRNSRP